MRITRPRLLLGVAALTSLLTLSACTTAQPGASNQPGQITVVASFYPLEFVADKLLTGVPNTRVMALAAPGVEPHDLEMSATAMAEISDAAMILLVPGFMPAADAAAKQTKAQVVDVTQGLDLLPVDGETGSGSTDPHVWLNPANMVTITNSVATRLTALDPASKAAIDANAADLTAQLNALNQDFTTGLATCRTRTMVVSHEAFGYLADGFALTQVGLSGLNPDAEPSPARLAEIAKIAATAKVTTIYFERLVSPDVANTLAKTLGIKTAPLDPIETAPATGDFISAMAGNLATLQAGQGCS